MVRPRKPKKSDTLEVRLSHEAKNALMQKARAEGRSASEVVRNSIDSYLAGQPKETRKMLVTMWKPAVMIGAAAFALVWGASAPLHARPDLQTVFKAVDRDGNGAISNAEFLQHPSTPKIQKLHAGESGIHAKMAAMYGADGARHNPPSPAELSAHFVSADSHKDGSISFAEFQAFHDQMKAQHGAH